MKNENLYYVLVSDPVTVEEAQFISYGIGVEESSTELAHFKDVSTEKEIVSKLVTMLNEMDAGSMHVADIIEDFLP